MKLSLGISLIGVGSLLIWAGFRGESVWDIVRDSITNPGDVGTGVRTGSASGSPFAGATTSGSIPRGSASGSPFAGATTSGTLPR